MIFEIILVASPLFTLIISLIPKDFSWIKGKHTYGRWHKFWKSWIPIPTGIGLTLLAVLQWRSLVSKKQSGIGVDIAKDWEITCYRAIPCRAFSRAWGWVSDCKIPIRLRHLVYGQYSSMYNVNLEEMSGALTDYPSLSQFFTRELKSGVRPIDVSKCLVSPADGKVLNLGKITSNKVEQIKGVTYSIQTFLGSTTWTNIIQENLGITKETKYSKDENHNEVIFMHNKEENKDIVAKDAKSSFDFIRYLLPVNFDSSDISAVHNTKISWNEYRTRLLMNPENEIYHSVVYLAPGDYHRFHSPVHWKIHFRRHFQGELLSVNPKIAGWIPELFCLNERVVYVGQWEHGFFCLVAVGATNVGSIKVYGDETLHTNSRKWPDGIRHKDQDLNLTWSKGEEVGEFKMGSTIVLIFEGPKHSNFDVNPGDRIKVGQGMFCTSTN